MTAKKAGGGGGGKDPGAGGTGEGVVPGGWYMAGGWCHRMLELEGVAEPEHSFGFPRLYPAKAFDCVDHNKLWKILQEMGTPDHLTCLLRNLYAQLELDMEQKTGPKLGKEYVKSVYCHPAYLTSLQSTS